MSLETYNARRAAGLCPTCGEAPCKVGICAGCTEIRRVKDADRRRSKGIKASVKPCSKCGKPGHTAIRHRAARPPS